MKNLFRFNTNCPLWCMAGMLLLLSVLSTSSYAALLAGTYTIDPSASASATNYQTLTDAISDMTAGTRADGGTANGAGISGAVIFELATGYTSGAETFPLSFGSITGASATNSITVRPAPAVSSALTITSANTTTTLQLSGAKYVYIDGRPGGTGTSRYLTIVNTTNVGATVKFINDAVYNSIVYTTLSGACLNNANVGVVFFGTAATTGNSNNKIDNCNIGDVAGTNTPIFCVNSVGIASNPNSNDTVSNCNVYNFYLLSNSLINSGINITSNSNAWYISTNRIYQTTSRTIGTLSGQYGIYLGSGDGHVVTGNIIGYSSASGTGTYTVTSTARASFAGIYANIGAGNTVSIQGNTIAGISFTAPSTNITLGTFAGIYINTGNANIGTIAGNIIGATTGTASITRTGYVTAGIYILSTGTMFVQNNTIGAIKALPPDNTSTSNLYGIYQFAGGGANNNYINCTGNVIGNTTASNMTSGDPAGGSMGITLGYGIYYTYPPATCIIANNTIQNFSLYGTNATSGNRCGGISPGSAPTPASSTITGNTVRNISSAGKTTGSLVGGVVTGIISGSGSPVVSGNTISGLASTSTGTGNYMVIGMFLNGVALSPRISRNVMYGFSNAGTGTSITSPPAAVGIYGLVGSDTIDNNMISLGNGQATNTTFAGMLLNTTTNNYVYNNTINIEGTASAGALATICLNRGNLSTTANTTPVDIRNNIFTNTRSGGTGKHYAIADNYNATASATGWGTYSSIYNVLNANGATVGYWNADQTFSAWKTASASDSNSLSGVTVTYVNSASDLHLNMGTTVTQLESGGTTIAGFATDIDGQVRPGPTGSVNGGATAPDMGADEFDGVPPDVTAPVISYIVLANSAATTTFTTTAFATITDPLTGVATASGSRPRLYYKKSTDNNTFGGNTSSTNGWKWVEATGTTSPFNFTVDYSIINGVTVSIGNVIQYFVVAQDQAPTPNTGANPATGFVGTLVSSITAAPTSPNSYTIVTQSTWSGTGTTWSTGGDWNSGSTPGPTDVVVIPGGLSNYPILTANQVAGNIDIQSGGSVTLNGGDLQLSGTFNNNGTVSGSGKISLNGTSTQIISGTTGSTGNLELNNSAGASITAANKLNITGTLTSTSGTLTTNSGLYLKSTASATGRIAAVAGTISGNVNIELYVPGQRGYRLLGHPYTTAQSLSTLSTYFDITGVTGANSICGGQNPSVFSYTPGATPAYVGITTAINTFPKATNGNSHSNGILAFVRGAPGQDCLTSGTTSPSNITFTTASAINQGTVNETVPANGWNLISNPYPSQVNLSQVTGVSSLFAIKVINPAQQNSSHTYTNGTAYVDLAATAILPVNGAFLANNNTGTDITITFTEASKTGSAPVSNTFKTTSIYPTLGLSVYNGTAVWDNWNLTMQPHTGNNAGDNGDLGKISNAQLDIYSLSADNHKLNWDARDADSIADGAVVALGVRSVPQAAYTLAVSENSLPASKIVYLHDKYMNSYTQLTNGTSYPFTVDVNAASQGEGRMELLFNNVTTGVNNVAATQNKIQVAPNPATSNVSLSYPTVFAGDKTISIMNAIGQVVRTVNTNDRIVSVDISGLASGVYVVKTVGNGNTAIGKFIKN
jgi:hypothetical protein